MSNPDPTRAIAEAMTALWQGEFPATMRVLSAVRDESREYRPHGKSRSAWELATHIATADLWFLESIIRGVFHYDADAVKRVEAEFTRVKDVVAFYEARIPDALRRVKELSSEQLAEQLDFFGMMQMTRAAWIGFSNNHSVHHRGQLSAYLRALGSKVPDIYGPSGDAEPMQPQAPA